MFFKIFYSFPGTMVQESTQDFYAKKLVGARESPEFFAYIEIEPVISSHLFSMPV